MKTDIIDLKTGVLYFGNKEFITAKTTFEEMLKMKGTIDHSDENLETGIQSLAFYNKEIDGNFYQISVHFIFGKLHMIFVKFKDGIQVTETNFWDILKRDKTNKHSKKGNISKSKNFDWGRVFAFYALKVNLGQFHISYK
jgi:hypothetical protein